MYNIYSIVILILFDIPRFSVNDLHQIKVAAPSPSSRKYFVIVLSVTKITNLSLEGISQSVILPCIIFEVMSAIQSLIGFIVKKKHVV